MVLGISKGRKRYFTCEYFCSSDAVMESDWGCSKIFRILSLDHDDKTTIVT